MTPAESDDLKPPMLTREERGRFYALLGADIPKRMRRIEYMLIALLASTGVSLFSGLPVERGPIALFNLIFG